MPKRRTTSLGIISLLCCSFSLSSPVGIVLLAFIVETGVDVRKRGHFKKKKKKKKKGLVIKWKRKRKKTYQMPKRRCTMSLGHFPAASLSFVVPK